MRAWCHEACGAERTLQYTCIIVEAIALHIIITPDACLPVPSRSSTVPCGCSYHRVSEVQFIRSNLLIRGSYHYENPRLAAGLTCTCHGIAARMSRQRCLHECTLRLYCKAWTSSFGLLLWFSCLSFAISDLIVSTSLQYHKPSNFARER